MRRSTMVVLAVLLIPVSAEAQSAPAEGERVYVRHEGRRIEGSLVALGDSLVIATAQGPAVVAPVPPVIYRHAGHTSRGKRFLAGVGIGGGVGAAVGAVIGYADGDDPPGWFSLRAEEKAVMAGVVLGGVGVVVGGITGLVVSGDKWEVVPIRPTLGIGSRAHADAVVVGFEARF